MEHVPSDLSSALGRRVHCTVRAADMKRTALALTLCFAVFFVVENLLGYQRILLTWLQWCSMAGGLGASIGIAMSVRANLARLPPWYVILPSVLLSIGTCMVVAGALGTAVGFAVLLEHASSSAVDIFQPLQVSGLRHLDGSEITMGIVATLLAVLSYLPFTTFRWFGLSDTAGKMLVQTRPRLSTASSYTMH